MQGLGDTDDRGQRHMSLKEDLTDNFKITRAAQEDGLAKVM